MSDANDAPTVGRSLESGDRRPYVVFMQRDEVVETVLAELATTAASEPMWSTLPPAAYCSAAIYELEIERVFRPG